MSGRSASPPDEDLPHEAHLAALAALEGVGPARLRWLVALDAPRAVWSAVRAGALPQPPPSLRIEPALLHRWRTEAAALDPAAIWRRCTTLGIGVVSMGGAGYPPALMDDTEPPVVLFHLGNPDLLRAPRVAIIGTRRATGYGLRTAEMLGRELSEAGVSVVSGLAIGIDASAHRGAVGVAGSTPVGVVGGGLDSPCPARNRDLAARVAASGVLISEVPPGTPAAPWRFPVRNRIIAALADAVVVVESATAGGSMHTVREALSRDRPVLAVPGPIDSRSSSGTNLLLSEGAHPCLSTEDVLVTLGRSRPVVTGGAPAADRVETRPAPTGDAAAVLDGLGWRPATAEQLARGAGLDFRRLSAALAELEASGWVVRTGGWVERIALGSTIRGGNRRPE